MQFKIGEAPEGWVRGNPLGFINEGFRWGNEAALYYKVLSPFDDIPEIAGVRFHKSDVAKVDAWLDWWYGSSEVAA
jgi:hypothetical protein